MKVIFLRTYLLLFLISLPFAGQAFGEVRERIRQHVGQLASGVPLQFGEDTIASVIVLPALYEKYDYQRIWRDQDTSRQLLSAIDSIYLQGLNPGDYHDKEIRSLLEEQETAFNEGHQAELDLLLTDSLIRIGYHLQIGKVDPEALDSNWNMNRMLPGLDPVLALSEAIDTGNVTQLIDSFRPQAPVYRNLMTALAQYRGIEAQGGWPIVPDGETLKPGMKDARITILRNRLHVTGDMPAENMESDLFDSTVEEGVKHFQQRHGLDDDGILGKETLAALNVSVKDRIDQIRVNLERARWILHDLPEEFVVADIAGFYVKYYRGGDIVWEGRAQVGKPYRKTPVFRDQIRYLEFNPTWTVPPTILRKDVLPAIKRDPDYLAKKNMRVLDGKGKPVDAAAIDWSQYPEKSFPYLIRQEPGPGNALGRIKFMFPNKHLVYLHDTPSKGLFEQSARAFSSGCIRVENPFGFAERLLENTPGWDRSRIMREVDTAKTSRVNLAEPVTVMLLYWTATADAAGTVTFKEDIYQRDAAVLDGLNEPFRFRDAPILDEQAGRQPDTALNIAAGLTGSQAIRFH
jgi:murein L,D-transpeptidase YcbB/YkuD